jgi:SAM-dependent methyltransferase
MKKITYDIEYNLERTHWWFTGRRSLLGALLSSLKIDKNSLAVDVGCGVGSNILLLNSLGFRVVGVDSEIYGLSLAQKNLPKVPFVNADLMMLPFKTNSIGLILALDVLEHLDEDLIGIKEVYRTLKPGGKVIFTAPAFRFLWGIQDEVGMHKRRYMKKELNRKVKDQGFRVLKSSYFNFFLFFPIFLARRLIHLSGLKVESENKINSPIINSFLKTIFSLESYVLRCFSFPFGVSIFCIARKSETI